MSSSTQTTNGIGDNDDYGNFNNGSTTAGTTYGLRRWSRNLSAQRHRELDRLNQIERRRQFLELKRQNDLFDQMSVTVNGPVAVAAAADKATTIPLKEATCLSPNERDTKNSNEFSDLIDQPNTTGPSANARQSNRRPLGASGEGSSKLSSLDGPRLTSLSPSPEDTNLKTNDNKAKAVELVDARPGAFSAREIQIQDHDHEQQQQRQQGKRSACDPADIRSSNLFVKRPVTSDQLARFVSSRVPENKRVLCLIVRDKMSRLNKAKSYFYPTYYLFIQAIVDIDDMMIAGEQGGSNNQLNSAGNENVTVKASTSVDNSFSASSSISADMLFIGASGENGGAHHLSSMKMLSGNSYSDNEVYAGTETEEDNNTNTINPMPADLQTKARVTTKQVRVKSGPMMKSAGSLQGRDSPLVFPNRDNNNNNNNCDTGESGSLVGASSSSAPKDLVVSIQSRDETLKGNATGVSGKLNSSGLADDLGAGRGKVLMKTGSKLSIGADSSREDGDDIDDDDYDDSDNDELNRNRWINAGRNEGFNHNGGLTAGTTTTGMVGATFISTFTPTACININNNNSNNDHENIQQSLFDNERNPFTGTYGVLLAGRRRKKAKTYLIGLNEYGYTRKNSICKLKSNVLGTQFNAISLNQADNNDRCNIASISYETNVLGFKGPRKMRVLLSKDPGKGTKNLAETFKKNPPAVVQLKNMTPSWNVESQSYVLNFHGRVTQASVKNFQLIESEMDYFGPDGTQRGLNNNQRDVMLNQFNPSAAYMDHEQQLQAPDDDIGRFPTGSSHLPRSTDHRLQGSGQQQAGGDELTEDSRNINALLLTSATGAHTSSLSSGNKGLTQYNSSIVMQFGRISNHEFTCDVTHPLSILQAFSIALSSFDSKLACE